MLEGGEGADDDEYEKAPPSPSAEDHDDRDWSLAYIGYILNYMIRVYLSPISLLSFTHTLSSFLYLSLSLCLSPSAFLAPSGSLPPLFLSVSTLRVRPESVKT